MGPLGSELIPDSRFTAGSRFIAGSFLTEGWARADRAVCFGAVVPVDFRAVCFVLGAGLAGTSSNAGQAAAASAPVVFRAVCLAFGAGLVGATSAFTFLAVVLAFLSDGVDESFTLVEGGSGCLRFWLLPSVERVFAFLFVALAFRSAA